MEGEKIIKTWNKGKVSQNLLLHLRFVIVIAVLGPGSNCRQGLVNDFICLQSRNHQRGGLGLLLAISSWAPGWMRCETTAMRVRKGRRRTLDLLKSFFLPPPVISLLSPGLSLEDE